MSGKIKSLCALGLLAASSTALADPSPALDRVSVWLGGSYLNTDVQLEASNRSGDLSTGKLDLGIIHYASDTPYTRAQTLGARGMSYYGLDSTYASTLALLRRIFEQTGIIESVAQPAAVAG